MRSLVASGDLVRTRRGVYATRKAIEFAGTAPRNEHVITVISALRVVEGGIVSHHSAARVYGLDLLHPPGAETVTFTCRRGAGTRGRREDIVRYRAELPAAHVTKTKYGFWATTPARTVVDIARSSTFMQGVVVADSLLRNEAATERDLRRVLDACRRWPGVEMARRVTDFADPLADSVLESCVRVAFHEHGLERPLLQESVAPGVRVDFCWPRYKLIAEADGLAKYETDPKRKVADQTRRDNRIRRLGYTIIHFTWAELFGSTTALVRDIKTAMAAARVG